MTSNDRGIDTVAEISTPVGPMRLEASTMGLTSAWFTDDDGTAHLPVAKASEPDTVARTLDAGLRALADYFRAGDRQEGTRPPLDLQGTDFQRAVWAVLLTIPYGSTRTYGQVAEQVGRPSSVRAVAAAIGANPVGILVPCHRVIGADGSLTGYAGGLERKRWLLAHEGAALRL